MTAQTTTALLDRAAIGLSALCMLHCLALPAAIVLLPSLASLPFADEHFHVALIFVVLPTSLVALFMGCRRHRHIRVLAWGGTGVAVLLGAAVFGLDTLGATWERILTVLGASLVAIGHLQNFSLCRSSACLHEEPSACLHEEPSACLHEEPSACLNKEPSACLHEEPSACLHEEPSACLNEEPSACLNEEPSACLNKRALSRSA